jgi:hypothetical protein
MVSVRPLSQTAAISLSPLHSVTCLMLVLHHLAGDSHKLSLFHSDWPWRVSTRSPGIFVNMCVLATKCERIVEE